MTFDCPRCGEATSGTVATEPGFETFQPCGCRVALDGGEKSDQSVEGIERPEGGRTVSEDAGTSASTVTLGDVQFDPVTIQDFGLSVEGTSGTGKSNTLAVILEDLADVPIPTLFSWFGPLTGAEHNATRFINERIENTMIYGAICLGIGVSIQAISVFLV